MNLLRERFAVMTSSVGSGLTMLPRDPELALKRLILPASYWRLAEFSYVWRWLQAPAGARVLDVGSPKELSCLLARRRMYEVVSCDIQSSEVEQARRYATAQRLLGTGPGTVTAVQQDARSLTYADGSFDAVVAVSVIEHIPDGGDTLAIQEFARVVKPGGRIVITTPYDHGYRETYVQRDVYEREQRGSESVFYERHYDQRTLQDRLIRPSRCTLVNHEVWGEGRLRVERILDRLGRLRTPLSPFEPILSTLFLKRVESPKHRPMAVFFTLESVQKG